MSPKARREYVADMRHRYAAATVVERGPLLDEVVAVTGYHRKYAITLMTRPSRPKAVRRRAKRYGRRSLLRSPRFGSRRVIRGRRA